LSTQYSKAKSKVAQCPREPHCYPVWPTKTKMPKSVQWIRGRFSQKPWRERFRYLAKCLPGYWSTRLR